MRTKDNIARVRRDEAKAAEEEKEKQRRALLAVSRSSQFLITQRNPLHFIKSTQEQETRTAILRTRARERQGLTSVDEPNQKEIQSHTETRYEIVIRNGACVSVPVTEERNLVQFTASGHVNFFANLEEGKQVEGVANKEHELEKKKEQEEYEKQIGLLTYLGQGSKESTGESAWYEQPSLLKTLKNQSQIEINHKAERAKDMFDPLRVIRHYIGKPESIKKDPPKKITYQSDLRFPSAPAKPESMPSSREKKHKKKKRKSKKEHKKSKKHKKDQTSKRRSSDSVESPKKKKKSSKDVSDSEDSTEESSDSSDSADSEAEKKKRLEVLRAKRLQREKAERSKANKLLAKINGTNTTATSREKKSSDEDDSDSDERPVKIKPKQQKYHSQYNPDLAKQNQPLDSNTKYWLQ